MPGNTDKITVSKLLRKISIAGRLLGGFQFDLTLNAGASLKFSVGSFRKNHLHLIFLANLLKSVLSSVSFILVGAGAKPKPFSETRISVSVKTFLLRLNTESEQEKPSNLSLVTLAAFLGVFFPFQKTAKY